MPVSDATLAIAIREMQLPSPVATIAVEGGGVVHPALRFRAQSVHPAAWSLVERSPGLVPLWSCGIDSAFADADRTFVMWSAEDPHPRRRFVDFSGLVRSLLIDLRSDEEDDDDRRAVASLLLPAQQVGAALRAR